MSGSATLATARLRLATAATRISAAARGRTGALGRRVRRVRRPERRPRPARGSSAATSGPLRSLAAPGLHRVRAYPREQARRGRAAWDRNDSCGDGGVQADSRAPRRGAVPPSSRPDVGSASVRAMSASRRRAVRASTQARAGERRRRSAVELLDDASAARRDVPPRARDALLLAAPSRRGAARPEPGRRAAYARARQDDGHPAAVPVGEPPRRLRLRGGRASGAGSRTTPRASRSTATGCRSTA